jgi:hypothetical protein
MSADIGNEEIDIHCTGNDLVQRDASAGPSSGNVYSCCVYATAHFLIDKRDVFFKFWMDE